MGFIAIFKKGISFVLEIQLMRILIFHNLLWSQYKSVVFEKVAEICVEKNDELLVIETTITEAGREDLVDFDLSTYPYKFPVKLLSTKPLQHISPWKLGFEWIKVIFEFKPNVINFTGYAEPAALPVLLLCKLLGIKTVMTIESVKSQSENQNGLTHLLKSIVKSAIFKVTDGFFSYGLNSNQFLFRAGIAKKKIFTFLNSFDKVKFRQQITENSSNLLDQIGEPYLLYVGRLSEEKNLFELIDLMKELPYTLKMAGNGPLLTDINKKIQQEKITNIHVLGTVAWTELADLYRQATCLILVSTAETWGMVANEAQELGKPVICTEACGCANDLILDGYNGLVIKQLSDLEERNRIKQFLKELPEKSEYYADHSKRSSQIFGVEKLANEMYQGFQQLN
ncbi:glycosyltransferase [Aquirufa ecclesiirivi]|uniref:Glycosyltransferase n=3 Tax=Aquirufa ecclesiirivi TaxID=2715124 RepID=A0ABT4JD41_9BACT|nr:glycosyltransferase [Aquirufa ecclesiirivi]MCZ2474198.1 glycosyltransferase [Aquirufa ecclesiirivi]